MSYFEGVGSPDAAKPWTINAAEILPCVPETSLAPCSDDSLSHLKVIRAEANVNAVQ